MIAPTGPTEEMKRKSAANIRTRAHFDKLFRGCISDRDYIRLAKRLYRLALNGKPWAAKLVCERLAGKTVQPHEVDGALDVRHSVDDQKEPFMTLAEMLAQVSGQPLALPPGVPQPAARRIRMLESPDGNGYE